MMLRLFFILSLLAVSVRAASLDDLTWEVVDGEVTITDCNHYAEGEMEIPETIGGMPVTTIGDSAFEGCMRLTEVQIPGSVIEIKREAFKETNISSLVIPDSVTLIGQWAFAYCGLRNISIGKNVSGLTANHFEGSGVTQIEVNPDNQFLEDVEGVLFEKQTKTLLKYPPGRTDAEYAIPEGILTIGMRAFCQCQAIGVQGRREAWVEIEG